jgi:energy-coupling factor transporter ATP-binding protein EcfA2
MRYSLTASSRTQGERNVHRFGRASRAFLATIVLAGCGENTAWAQKAARTLPLARKTDPRGGLKAKCSLDGEYGPVQFESFLMEANRGSGGFIDEFESALRLLMWWESDGSRNKTIPAYQIFRVTDAPGAGKSALLRYLNRILEPESDVTGTVPDGFRSIISRAPTFNIKEHIVTLKLDEMDRQFAVRSTMLDDLTNDGGFRLPAFGKLRAFDYDDHAAPGVEFLVRAFSSEGPNLSFLRLIIIIDSIDEIHPESAKSLLTRLDDYIKQREKEDEKHDTRGFLRIFVVGRAEGFTDYYRIVQGGVPKTKPIKLCKPYYRSLDDAACAARSVVRFNILGGKDQTDDNTVQGIVNDAINFAHQHRWLEESFYNLSQFGDLIRLSSVDAGSVKLPRSFNDPYQLNEILFQALLARARNAHNRPITRSQEYVLLLEEVACKFARSHQIDQEGYFMVTPNDFVEIDVPVGECSQTSSYLVESVLNRSGVVDLESVNLFPKYRFYPSWLREHLLERHRRRLKKLAEQGNFAPPSCCR